MRVGINARILSSPELRGWNRYTVNLLEELSKQDLELVLYSDQPLYTGHLERIRPGTFSTRISPSMPYIWWEQHWLPRQCATDRIDVLHSPFNFGLPWSSPCPRVLTLHDAIDQAYYGPHRRWKETLSRNNLETQMYHWIARKRAHQIITVSEHAKEELVRYLHLAAGKITVTHEGADPCFHAAITDSAMTGVPKKYDLAKPYVFYVGGWEKRKNVPFLLRAFAAAALDGVDLALAGGKAEQRSTLGQLVQELGIEGRVKLLGWVPDTELPALYAGALAFVYPSEHEGFGLQLCEAMAMGCPVLAARATSLPEVLGAGGETFSLSDTSELSRLLQRVAQDNTYRSELVRRAQARSGQLSWRRTAEQTVAVYRRAIDGAMSGGTVQEDRALSTSRVGL